MLAHLTSNPFRAVLHFPAKSKCQFGAICYPSFSFDSPCTSN